jgi:hypothetical protein
MERALRAFLARRYEDYGAQDLAHVLRDAFSEEIRAEKEWIARALAQSTSVELTASGQQGGHFNAATLPLGHIVSAYQQEQDQGLGSRPTDLAMSHSPAAAPEVTIQEPVPPGRRPKPASPIASTPRPTPPPRRGSRLPWVIAGMAVVLTAAAVVVPKVMERTGIQGTPTPVVAATTAAPTPTPKATKTPRQVQATPTPVRRRTPRPTPRIARSTGWLSVNVSGGWAKVWVDGSYKGTTPLIRLSVPTGKHRITVKQGEKTWTKNVIVEKGGAISLVAPF